MAKKDTGASQPISNTWMNRLRRSAGGTEGGALETVGGEDEVDLSDAAIQSRVAQMRERLTKYIGTFSKNTPEQRALVEEIAKLGEQGLRLVRDEDDEGLRNNADAAGALEAIVRDDGTRPSFLVQFDVVNPHSSFNSTGDWVDEIDRARSRLGPALKCVGRINAPGGKHVGTGFLIQEDLIVTNRHVLQAIATDLGGGHWDGIKDGQIDFGSELEGRTDAPVRRFLRVAFAGKDVIDPKKIDHSKMDFAVIQLEPATTANRPGSTLAIKRSATVSPDQAVYVVGYPGRPRDSSDILTKLFADQFGFKRLAPGQLRVDDAFRGRLIHDATTLGGNSGSALLVSDGAFAAVGLHYGGIGVSVSADPQNWGHLMARLLETPSAVGSTTLGKFLEDEAVPMLA